MINLKELSERYKDVGLGYIHFGGHSYYEINSDVPLSLNSFGGKDGFVLNDKGEVELFELNYSDDYRYFFNGAEVSQDKYWELEDSEMYDDISFEIVSENKKWWGKTLDNYYPHPWFPDRKIIAFELVNDIPFFRKGKVFNLFCGDIECDYGVKYSEDDCLQLPEFFKPVYDEQN